MSLFEDDFKYVPITSLDTISRKSIALEPVDDSKNRMSNSLEDAKYWC